MNMLMAGVALWTVAHLFKRLAPVPRAKLGNAGKGLVAVVLILSLVLMVKGYRAAEVVNLYYPPGWAVHVNNLLMLVAVMLFGMSATKGQLRGKLRHPMLTGVMVWAFAHLLVNGDLASIMLFGGLGAWAITEMFVINATEAGWNRPEPGSLKGDAGNLIITVILFAIITGIHVWAGRNPFLGTYG